MEDKALVVGESILPNDISLFVNCILIDYIQRRDEDPWDLLDLFQWEREDESMGHIFNDQRAEDFFVDQCNFMIPKLDGFVNVIGSLLVNDF